MSNAEGDEYSVTLRQLMPNTADEKKCVIRFAVGAFVDHQYGRGQMIVSPVVNVFGYEWQIQVYPRGHPDSPTDEEFVSCYLKRTSRMGGRDVVVNFCFLDPRFPEDHVCVFGEGSIFGNGTVRGMLNYDTRESIIRDCQSSNGSLDIVCRLRIHTTDNHVWYPKKLEPIATNEDDSLVSFNVEGALYFARKLVLSRHANKLYDMFEEWDSSDKPIPILSVSSRIFGMILQFISENSVVELENESIARELLVASDRFECLYVKLHVESVIVDKFLKPENAAALFIFADSYSCALLKEAAMFLCESDEQSVKRAVKSADAWSEVIKSTKLLEDLYTQRSDEFDEMDVTSLRKELEAVNHALDGSREVLVNRLCTHRRSGP